MSAPDPDAPLVLTLYRDRYVADIPDHEGEVWRYQVRRRHGCPSGYAVDLQHLDRRETTRHVRKPRGRLWACDCEDARFRANAECRLCKHRYAVERLSEFAREFAPESETLPMPPKKTTDAPSPPQTPAAPPADAPAVQAAPQAATIETIAQALAAPFDVTEVKFKPQTVSGNRALAVPFVDARVIQDRLDDVLGVMGWQDSYECLPDGSVVCRLKIRLGDEWITKEDVGGQSEQPDEGDRRKAAFSDALKRAAVKFGVGRYLYRQKPQWCDYDPQKRQFIRPPVLSGVAQPQAQAVEKPAKPAKSAPLTECLQAWDEAAVAKGACQAGELTRHVVEKGRAGGFAADADRWSAAEVKQARAWAGEFVAERRAPAKAS